MGSRTLQAVGAGAHADRLELMRRRDDAIDAWAEHVMHHVRRGDSILEAWRKANVWEASLMPVLAPQTR